MLLSYNEGLALLLGRIKPLEPLSLPLRTAHLHFLAEDITSDLDLPHFDNSAMDGYAVIAESLSRANPQAPVELDLVGESSAGFFPETKVSSGNCMRIFTGAPMPEGADSVVKQEEVKASPNGKIVFTSPARTGQNVRNRGEDIRKGEKLISAGERITHREIAVLSSLGRTEIRVHPLPRVDLLTTGNEVVPPGSPLDLGKLYDSNSPLIEFILAEWGIPSQPRGIVTDDIEVLVAKVAESSQRCDIILISGGISVGDYDVVRLLFERYCEVIFLGLKVKPGKPVSAALLNGKLLIALPGNPASCAVAMSVVVQAALRKASGAKEAMPPLLYGKFVGSSGFRGETTQFLRCKYYTNDGEVLVESSGPQQSGIFKTYLVTDCIVIQEPKRDLKDGDIVPFLPVSRY